MLRLHWRLTSRTRLGLAGTAALAGAGGLLAKTAWCRSNSSSSAKPFSPARKKLVFFMRHGESLSNASGTDAFTDPAVTDAGEGQGESSQSFSNLHL